MSEQNEAQPGEWWIRNDGSVKVYIVGTAPDGSCVYETKNGEPVCGDDWSDWHHEPRCNSWEWHSEPEPEWFDLTAMDGHVLRQITDQSSISEFVKWLDPYWPTGTTIAKAKTWGWTQFRCLLKDAPTPKPKPATQTIVFHEFMVRCGVGNEDWQLKWRTSKPKTNNWIPTGRTETREVVR